MTQSESNRSLAEWRWNVAPQRRLSPLHLSELWTYRELVYFFATRDLKVRYKQAVLGVGWVLVQPLAGAFAFTLLFNGLADIKTDGSYFVFALVGFIVWTYFSSGVSDGTRSLLYNTELIAKVSFPKIALPAASLVPGFIDLGIGASIAVVWSIVDGEGVHPLHLAVGFPLGLALLLVATAGPALLFATVIVKYRDAGVIVGFGLQLLLFLSPVAYPPELVPDRWATLQYVNPVAGCLALFRWALSSAELPDPGRLALSVSSALVVFVFGLTYFRANERYLVDVI